ncbi:MAG: hypothetical protein GY861_14265 [bacterium]|nr:hypothetical protein [bacterium]
MRTERIEQNKQDKKVRYRYRTNSSQATTHISTRGVLQSDPNTTNTTNTTNAPSNSPTNSQHIRISVRLPRGIVTSLTLKKNIIAIWLLYRAPSRKDPQWILDIIEKGEDIKEDIKPDTIMTIINTFVYSCLESWDKDTGKGLSDFVTELMIDEALEPNDHSIYSTLMGLIG